nr:phage portal protein [Desulfovibrio cuneatus]
MAFSFGDPEPILAGQLYEGLGSALMDNGRYYQTPVPLTGMARLLRANAFHGPILEFKMNQVMRGFAGSTVVNRNTMRCMAMDFLVFANAYAQVLRNGFGEVVALRHLPAINMRRHKEANRCCQLTEKGEIIDFMPGEVLHLKNYDVTQEIYGMPSYLGAIQSMLLNEDATLFRRRYYKNGAHMGYIFYSSSAGLSMNDQAAIKKAVHGSKGVGNFKNMFLHIPNGREKDVQILPVGDFSTRDELTQIKNISRDDIIAAHRIPPAMANIIPTAAGGLGDITKVDSVYQKNEIDPIRDYLLEINDFLPKGKGISFKPDTLPGGPGGAGGKPKE